MTDILTGLVQALLPHALEILGAVLTVLIGWAADAARRNWGIQIEAKHREALQSALLTGARMAIQRGGGGLCAVQCAGCDQGIATSSRSHHKSGTGQAGRGGWVRRRLWPLRRGFRWLSYRQTLAASPR
jgi:hypothetical protein